MSVGVVVAAGARAPAGLSALQVAMAVRAAAVRPEASEFLDREGRPVGMPLVGGVPPQLWGYDRIVELASPVLRELVPSLAGAPLPLVVAVAEAGRPDDESRFDGQLPTDLARRSGVPIDLDHSRTVRAGHAGGALAVMQAGELIAHGAPAVIVGGVDSYAHPEVVRWLDEGYRLHATGAENGMVPSEAAGFFVMRAPAARGVAELEPLATVTHASAGLEQSVASGEPNLARTVTTLLRPLVDDAGAVGWTICDVNGERHRVREWQMLAFRELWAPDHIELRLPERLGDVGAASGALAVVIAAQLWRTRCAPAPSCVVVVASEGTERGVLRLERAS